MAHCHCRVVPFVWIDTDHDHRESSNHQMRNTVGTPDSRCRAAGLFRTTPGKPQPSHNSFDKPTRPSGDTRIASTTTGTNDATRMPHDCLTAALSSTSSNNMGCLSPARLSNPMPARSRYSSWRHRGTTGSRESNSDPTQADSQGSSQAPTGESRLRAQVESVEWSSHRRRTEITSASKRPSGTQGTARGGSRS